MANCWEVKRCGREPGGARAQELGVCPATTTTSLNGVHGGKNGGRACWVLTGTLCGGKVQGSFAAKTSACLACEHYQEVRRSAGPALLPAAKLLAKIV